MNRTLTIALFTLCSLISSMGRAADIKIGFILSTMQEERYAKDRLFFEDQVKKLGGKVIFAACDNSERSQADKVENMLAKGIKVLVIQPVNSDAAAPFVEAAHKAGIPVIAYDRIINKADLDYYVTQDSFAVGKMQAEAAVKATGGKGNYVILSGQAGHSVAAEITRGNMEVLKGYKEIKVISQQNHNNWSASEAMATVENVLSKQKNAVAAILANNSGMANGAVQALEQQALTGKVFVAGADADLPSIRNIIAGKQQFEVLKDWKPLAETAANLAMELAKGNKPKADAVFNNGFKDVPTVNTPVFPVNKENVDKQIVSYGIHSKEAVYGR